MALFRKSFNSVTFNKFQLGDFTRSITIMAQLNAQKFLEDLKDKNPYFEKYSEKIAAIQQTSPQEFISRVNISSKKIFKAVSQPQSQRDYSELLRPKIGNPTTNVNVLHKKLDEIMKVELLSDKTPEEIKKIWLEYHKEKDVLTATISTNVYELQMSRGKENPMFILPLPRSQGYEFILLQFSINSVHFTPLLAYQVHKENAPECLNMIYYTEFLDKDVILMKAEYDNKVINVQEAQCLANQLQLYYAQNDVRKLALLGKFTKQPDAFKHMDVINELENLEI